MNARSNSIFFVTESSINPIIREWHQFTLTVNTMLTVLNSYKTTWSWRSESRKTSKPRKNLEILLQLVKGPCQWFKTWEKLNLFSKGPTENLTERAANTKTRKRSLPFLIKPITERHKREDSKADNRTYFPQALASLAQWTGLDLGNNEQ